MLRVLISTFSKLPLQLLGFLASFAVHARHRDHIRVVERIVVVEDRLQLSMVEQTGDHFVAALRQLVFAVFVDRFLIDHRGNLCFWEDFAFWENLARFGAVLAFGWM